MELQPRVLNVPRLVGGGLLLGYRCPGSCRHCVDACGPHRTDGLPASPEAFEALLDTLAARAGDALYHLGGGEPFLDQELLSRAVRGMRRRKLRLEYVETNASWVRDESHAAEALERLRDEGLTMLHVSVSPFHAEWIPFGRTLALIEAAERVLPGGVFVWLATFLEDVAGHPEDELLDLTARLCERGDGYALGLADRYGMVPVGRAARFMHQHGYRLPWRDAARGGPRAPCALRLSDTTHFHVDAAGNYLPGLCPGLVLPLAEVPGRVSLDPFPLLRDLLGTGPGPLVERALGLGFRPDETYASACDLCAATRTFLYHRAPEPFAELGPPGFYDPRSLGFERP